LTKTCYIFGAGEYGGMRFDTSAVKSGFVIAADGGYSRLEDLNIVPDLLVGDFDSLDCIPDNVSIIRHPVMKNETDMLLAADEGLKRGCLRFIMYGGLGGRLDHTIANIQLLTWLANRGALGYLAGGGVTLTVIREASLRFEAGYEGTVSVFSMGDSAEGVTLSGLKYSLENAAVTNDFAIGVSNEFTGTEAVVSVKKGSLLVSWLGNLDKPLPETYNDLN